jgi:Protein of unknown function (DUF1236)
MQNQGSGQDRQPSQSQSPSGKDRQGQAQPDKRGQKETTGQAPQRDQNAQGKEQGKEQGKDAQREKGQTQREQRGKDQTTGQNPREGGAASPSPSQTQREQGQGQREGQMPQRQQGQQGQQNERSGNQAQGGANSGANQGGSNVTLSTEQRTKIRETVLRGGNVPRVSNVNFSISVGTTVPTSVHVVEVSPVLVEIHPEWRGYFYFVVNDEIIIVDRGHRIIAVITV